MMDVTQMSGEETMALFYAGDERGMNRLVALYERLLYATASRLARGRCRDPVEAARDIVQLVWLHVVRTRDDALARWKPPHPVCHWLHGVVLPHRAEDYFRRETKETSLTSDVIERRPDPGTEAALGQELLAMVESWPEQRRRVWTMRRIEGMSVAEIVTMTGLSQTTVYRLIAEGDQLVLGLLTGSAEAPPRRERHDTELSNAANTTLADEQPLAGGTEPVKSFCSVAARPASEIGKIDGYLEHLFEAETTHEDATLPVVVRLKDVSLRWTPPNGFRQHSRIGRIVSGRATKGALQQLKSDPAVAYVETSRSISADSEAAPETAAPAGQPQQQVRPKELGDRALVAVVDDGIDVAHPAFADAHGRCRIVGVWDQGAAIPGKRPCDLFPQLTLEYGAVYTAEEIQSFATAGNAPKSLTGGTHGTSVASLAAGRACENFSGGVAGEARIVVVVTLKPSPQKFAKPTGTDQGFEVARIDALNYISAVADSLKMPVVVNLSFGINAGAHDGSSTLEIAIDDFLQETGKVGRVVVKSAGNERNKGHHASLKLIPGETETLPWSVETQRSNEFIELWFDSGDELRFQLCDPAGESSKLCTQGNTLTGRFQSGNKYKLDYETTSVSPGRSRLWVVLAAGDSKGIAIGNWRLSVEAVKTKHKWAEVHAWIERLFNSQTRFTKGVSEEVTLTIPGTAIDVITVGAVGSTDTPLLSLPASSWGPMSDNREKPEVAARGDVGVDFVGKSAQPFTGTSLAAAYVTGAIARILSWAAKKGDWPTAREIRAALIRCAQGGGKHAPGVGFGLLDAEELFRAFSGQGVHE